MWTFLLQTFTLDQWTITLKITSSLSVARSICKNPERQYLPTKDTRYFIKALYILYWFWNVVTQYLPTAGESVHTPYWREIIINGPGDTTAGTSRHLSATRSYFKFKYYSTVELSETVQSFLILNQGIFLRR